MDEPEALRRRLYAPGAGDADVAAFRRVAPREAPSPGSTPARRPRRLAPLLVAAVLIAVAGVATALVVPRAPTVAVAGAVPTSSEDRADLLQHLRAGGAAGIAAYLLTNQPPAQLRGIRDPLTQELHGTGDDVMTIGVPGAARKGRATVLLVTTGGRATWTALPPAAGGGSGGRSLERTTSRTQDLPPGALTATTFRYADGARPVRLRVEAPDGVRWGAAVVFSD